MRKFSFAYVAFLTAIFITSSVAADTSSASDEVFAMGMTVSLAGTQRLEFCLKVEAPMPLADLWMPRKEGHILPLDLWIVNNTGEHLSIQGTELLDPVGKPVPPREPGRWRVEMPDSGFWRLIVQPIGSPWRLWSAFHPFMLSSEQEIVLDIGRQEGALFFEPTKQQPFEIVLETSGNAAGVSLLDENGSIINRGRVSAAGTTLLRGSSSGVCRLDIRGPSTVGFLIRGIHPWIAFTPWDCFGPHIPDIQRTSTPGD